MVMTILLVDDKLEDIDLLDALLAPEGYNLVRAQSGEEALSYLSNNQPDLILLDVVMPGMSGFSTLKEIRRSGRNKSVPVILLTSLTDREDKLKGLNAGADDYISKPFDSAELVFKVKTQAVMSVLRRQVNEKEKLAGVMDLLFEGAVLTDSAFNILQMNKTAMRMLGMNEHSGNIQEVLLEKFNYLIDASKKSGRFIVGRGATVSSPAIFLSAEYLKVAQSNSAESSNVFVFKDVTEDYARNKMKMDFLSLLSAKLRAPLAVISGYSTMLSVFETEEKLKDIAVAITRNSDLMDNIMKRVIFFVELENTSLTGTETDFDVRELVERLVLVYKKGCDLSTADDVVRVKYWQALALEELIGNAIKFNDKERAKLSVQIGNDLMIVEDNGPGIPENERLKVSETLYQISGDQHGQTDDAGIGIGLAVVKRLAESANMTVKLETGAKGGLRVVISRKAFEETKRTWI